MVKKSVLILFSIIIVLIFLFSHCTIDENKVRKVTQKDTIISVEKAKNVEISYTDSGKLRAKIFAPLVIGHKQSSNPFTEMPEGVNGDFFNTSMELESHLDAKYAIHYTEKKLIELRNNIHITNTKNEKLETELLFWDQVSQKIYTDKYVKITTPDQILYGDGMEARQDFTGWRIKNIRGTISLRK